MLQQCCITFQDGGAIKFKMKNCFSKTPICELTKLNHPPTQPSSHSTSPSSPSKHHPHSLPNTTLIAFQTPPSSPFKHQPHSLPNASLIPFQTPPSSPSKQLHPLPNTTFIAFQTPASFPSKHHPHSFPNASLIPFQTPASSPSKHRPRLFPNTTPSQASYNLLYSVDSIKNHWNKSSKKRKKPTSATTFPPGES